MCVYTYIYIRIYVYMYINIYRLCCALSQKQWDTTRMTSLLLKTAHNASPPPSASLHAHHPPPRTENFSCRIQILWRDESQIMAGVGAKAKAREKSFSSS